MLPVAHPPDIAEVVAFFKALRDANRLRIVGLLMERPRTGEELSLDLHLGAPTVSHHLRLLIRAGLVTAVPDQYYRVYSVNRGRLQELAGRVLDAGSLAPPPDREGAGAFEKKVLRDFFEAGRLKTIPRQRRKREVILRQLVRLFEPGRDYLEAEVKETLGRSHEDTATLRREMIGYGLMAREQGRYRRTA